MDVQFLLYFWLHYLQQIEFLFHFSLLYSVLSEAIQYKASSFRTNFPLLVGIGR